VRTTREWKAGEKIGDFIGVRMSKTEFRQRYGKDLTYTYYVRHNFSSSYVLVAKETRNFVSFINEGLEPSVELKRYALWAKRDMAAGEECLLRYNAYYPRTYTLT